MSFAEEFTIEEEIYVSEKTVVVRIQKFGNSVILKTLRSEYPTPAELSAIKHEYEILQKISNPRIIKALSLEKYKSGLAIILEDIGGIDLFKILKAKRFTLKQNIEIMLAASRALSSIHNLNIVHRDIKAHNIIFNEISQELRIIDFGSANFLVKEKSFISLNSSIEGTLAYISPEQTGRMNRTVDYRTDFYSLGITFYQLLTGDIPFIYSDPMELVHAHIAKIPVSPFEIINAGGLLPITLSKIVRVVSDITMKLLQKNPEDRYQSANGIIHDLEWCVDYMNALESDNIQSREREDFIIGQNDISLKFQIPEKLYGRTKEIIPILKSFTHATEGEVELVLISGRSGSGKSVLINEINKPIVEYRGYFASGKYDQYKKNIPYYAITSAFQNLLKQILAENNESIQRWKENLQASVGLNGKVITEVIPELEILIGEQPEVPSLGINESQNRFRMVFQSFIKAFCKQEHPITIFLDDLQWADTPSIALVESILTDPEIKFLLLILSFRDNEVLPTDPFTLLLENLQKKGLKYKSILLNPFSVQDISYLVADTLRCEKKEAKQLAEILHRKTKGNPFFVTEMFKNLQEKGLLEIKEERWSWNIQKIAEAKITENVIDLLVDKVKDLSLSQAETLKLAACIGDSFLKEIIFLASDKDRDVVNEELTTISNEGFLIVSKSTIRFVHDKVREATYTLISEEEKSKNHYRIGNTYLNYLKEDEREDHIFTIVSQLNFGLGFVRSSKEREQLIELNSMAGKKALAASAYDSALIFLNCAVHLLSENSWKSNYLETLNLYTLKARAESLSAKYALAESTFESIINNAQTVLDRISAYELKSYLYSSQLKLSQSITIAANALKLLNVSLPKKPKELSVIPELIKTRLIIGKKSAKDYYDLPQLNNETDSSIMRLLCVSISPSYLMMPNLFPVLVMKMVNLSLRKGISSLSPFAFIIYAMILGAVLGDFKNGEEWGKLAIDLINKHNFKSVKAKTFMVYGCAILHWTHHAKTCKEFILQSIQAGIENGDSEYAGYALIHLHFQAFAMRKPLKEILDSIEKFRPSFLKIRQEHSYNTASIIEQTVINFSNPILENPKLQGVAFKEDEIVPFWTEASNSSMLNCYYTVKCHIGYFFEDPNEVDSYAKAARVHQKSNLGTMFLPEFVFFESLNLRKLYYATEGIFEKRKIKNRLCKNYKAMKSWANSCEANYGHKLHIISGLLEEIRGKAIFAVSEYKKAIQLAKKYDYILEEAIAHELSAAIWNMSNDSHYENLHLQEAYHAYKKWGFEAKVKELENKYPNLKRKNSGLESNPLLIQNKTISGNNFLDLNTVIKASQTISAEIQLAKLLEKMMKILIENAGAERGFFILKDNDNLLIEAEGNSNSNLIQVLGRKNLEGTNEISEGIVNYVARTKHIVLLNDATRLGMFVKDSYIKEKSPKSILCYPIVNQGNLVGVVYLENNLTTDAFSSERIEILKVLSSQIAVSIDNSLLYASLEEKVSERTRDLNAALVEVRALKEQQDGDYFLNTLLIEPLAQNKASSMNIEIEFFIKQKKQFVFRNGYYELGGDINISENLELQKNKYIVFLNGDAMGKSIQGAGGVLVLGTVFKSIIHRTNSTDYGKMVYPENWLKNAFIEMHKAFVSFDGSMLMSLVFGLIEERTGVMYFLNAEHPDIVLYRDGKASFIEANAKYTKLGTQGQTGSISIQVFSLLPGDTIISGSDGRDDIVIGMEENSEFEIINEDHDVFLRHVEHAEGDVKKIFHLIASSGKLIDDISLCKITYKRSPLTESKVSLEETLLSMYQYKMESKIEKFIKAGEQLIADYPHLTNYLYEISAMYKDLKQFNKAIELAERARIRFPKNFNNLLVLLESYIAIGNLEKARITRNTCLEINPTDERLRELISLTLKNENSVYPEFNFVPVGIHQELGG